MPQGDVPVGVNLEGMVGHTECYALLGGNPARESHIWEYDPRGSHEERLVRLAAYFVPGGRADARSSGRHDCRPVSVRPGWRGQDPRPQGDPARRAYRVGTGQIGRAHV